MRVVYENDSNYMKELWQTNKKHWFQCHWNRFKVWCYDNKEWLIIVVPAVAVNGRKIIKSHNRAKEVKQVKDHRDLDIYDRSLGIYYRMNRKPTPAEYGEITRRKRNGEDYYTILSSMRLL